MCADGVVSAVVVVVVVVVVGSASDEEELRDEDVEMCGSEAWKGGWMWEGS